MSDSDKKRDLAIQLGAPSLVAVLTYLLPIAFPVTLIPARIFLVIILFGTLVFVILRFRQSIARVFKAIFTVLSGLVTGLIGWVRGHRFLAAGAGGIVLLLLALGLLAILRQPVVAIEKDAVSCSAPAEPVPQLCSGRGPDYVEIVIKVMSRHPLADLPPESLTDTLSEEVGPVTLADRTTVKAPGRSFWNSTTVTVPSDKWLRYEPGSTIQIQRGSSVPTRVADSSTGQGALFLGVKVRVQPDFPWARQPSHEFAYLVHFVDAPQPRQGLGINTTVKNLSRGGAEVSQGVAMGDRLRVQLDLTNLTRYPLWDAVVTSKVPAVASDTPAVFGVLSSGLGTVSDPATISLAKRAYLNYMVGSTTVARNTDPPASWPDVDGIGPLFTQSGIAIPLMPGSDLHLFCYFDVQVQDRPASAPVPVFVLR